MNTNLLAVLLWVVTLWLFIRRLGIVVLRGRAIACLLTSSVLQILQSDFDQWIRRLLDASYGPDVPGAATDLSQVAEIYDVWKAEIRF